MVQFLVEDSWINSDTEDGMIYPPTPQNKEIVQQQRVDVNQKTESIFVRRPKGCSPSDIILYGNASPRKKIQMLEILKTKGGEFTGKKHEQIAVHIFDPDI